MPAKCCKETWNKVTEDEPVFILRGQDKLAIATIAYWIGLCESIGVKPGKIEHGYEHLESFLDFKRNNPNRMKIPD